MGAICALGRVWIALCALLVSRHLGVPTAPSAPQFGTRAALPPPIEQIYSVQRARSFIIPYWNSNRPRTSTAPPHAREQGRYMVSRTISARWWHGGKRR